MNNPAPDHGDLSNSPRIPCNTPPMSLLRLLAISWRSILSNSAVPRTSVLHVTPSLSASSGLHSIALGLSQAQRALGMEAGVLYPGVKGHREYPRLPFPTWGPSAIRFSPSALQWIVTSEASQFDVLHQHSIWSAFSLITMRWRKRFGGPTVIAPQGTLSRVALALSRRKKQVALRLFEEANLREATAIQVTSAFEAEAVRRLGFHNPIAIIPNGVDDAWVSEQADAVRFRQYAGIAPDKHILLFLSRLHSIKGLDLFIKCVARARPKLFKWHFVIAGPFASFEYSKRMYGLIAELGLENMTTFIGELGGQHRRDAFHAADLFVLPSRSDNFGIVVAEALGAGTPVLTTTGAPVWNGLEAEGCGWYVERRISDMTAALVDAVSMAPEERRQMGDRGRRLISQQFLWSRIAHMTAILYAWLLGTAHRPSFVLLADDQRLKHGRS